MTDITLPLEGIRVLDFAQFMAGPVAALRLADLGAEVIKVERPNGGDLCRQMFVADLAFEDDSLLFHTINRNKRSVTADLKDEGDLGRVRSLIASADVMIHNFRPGVMERIGLGHDEVSSLNPRLVYGVVTGYGAEGPWRSKPGQDLLVQSLTGLPWLSGNRDGEPVPVGLPVIDMAAGNHLVQGILAALVRRGVNGKGGLVEVDLMSSALDLQFEPFTCFLNGLPAQPERSAVANANVFGTAPYGIYRCADGHLALAMTPIKRLGELIDCPALEPYHDPDLAFRERDAIKTVIAEHLATGTVRHWLSLLEPADIWCAEVLDWPSLERTEGFDALDAVHDVKGASGQVMKALRCPIRIDGQTLTSPKGAPTLGADTDELLG